MVLVITPTYGPVAKLVVRARFKTWFREECGFDAHRGYNKWPYSIRVEYLFRNQGIQVRILLGPHRKNYFFIFLLRSVCSWLYI